MANPSWDDTSPLGPSWDETQEVSEKEVPISTGNIESMAPAPSLKDDELAFKLREHKEQMAQISTFDNEPIKEGIRRGLSGMEQLGIRFREATGLLPAGSTEKFTIDEEERRARYDYDRRYKSQISESIGLAVGELAPFLPIAVVPGGGAMKMPQVIQKGSGAINAAKSVLFRSGRIGVDTASGATVGALQYAKGDDERTSNILFGALAAGGVRSAVEVYDMLRPTNLIRTMSGIARAQETKTAEEGRDLSKAVNAPLNLSEETGSTEVLGVELMARRGRGVSEIVQVREETQANGALRFFKTQLDSISSPNVAPEEVGTRVKNSFSNAIDKLVTERRNGWHVDMAEATKAAGATTKFIQVNNLRTTVDTLLKELNNPHADASTKAVAKELTKELGLLGDKKTIKDAQVLLAKYTDWATGSGRILKDIETGKDRFVGVMLKDAFLKDLDATITSSPLRAGAIALQKARTNYRLASQDLDALGEEVVSQMLNKINVPTISHFADFFKKASIRPEQIKSIIAVLDKHDPGATKMLQRKWVDDAISAATKRDPEKMPGMVDFDPKVFLKEMDFYADNTMAVFTKEQRAKIQLGVRYIERIFPRGRAKIEVPAGETRAVEQAAMNLTSLNTIFLMGQIAKTVAPKAFAKALLTDEGITALRVAASPKQYPPSLVAESVFFLKNLEDKPSNK